ncbi:YciI family protein [Nocardia brevicatena]|uniref:YciI family protein n=1 Tax=Nocardia brevicatena TaxID=37327 RepID=UPI0012F746AD|nr:YciI family protein [Nocardia brevicatena]
MNVYRSVAALPWDGSGGEPLPATAGHTGELLGEYRFADPSLSAVVGVRNGVVSVTEGPYLPTRDQVAVQYLLDCDSHERAVGLAALLSRARIGGVEVRPLMDAAGMEM